MSTPRKKTRATTKYKSLLTTAEREQRKLYQTLRNVERMAALATPRIIATASQNVLKQTQAATKIKRKHARAAAKTRKKIAENIKLGKGLADSIEKHLKRITPRSKSRSRSRSRKRKQGTRKKK